MKHVSGCGLQAHCPSDTGQPSPLHPSLPLGWLILPLQPNKPHPCNLSIPQPWMGWHIFISLGQQAPHSCSSGVGRQLPVSHTSVCCVGKSLLPSWGWTSARGSVGRQDGRSGEAVSSWEFALLSLFFFFQFFFLGGYFKPPRCHFCFPAAQGGQCCELMVSVLSMLLQHQHLPLGDLADQLG